MEDPMIESRYSLPAVFAAGAHLVFLFSFPSKWTALGDLSPPLVTVVREIPLDPIVLAAVQEENQSDSVAGRSNVSPAPRLLENPLSNDHLSLGVQLDLTPASVVAVARLLATGTLGIGGEGMGTLLSGSEIFSSNLLDRPPRALVQLPPAYPAAFRQAGIEGRALVEFTVDTAGRVVSVRVLEASSAEFGESAVRAIRLWRFEPGKIHGRPVRFQMCVPVEFNLRTG